jgi:DNA-binding LacI/PurR family transcriptional regulator
MAGIGQVCKQTGMSLMVVPPMRGSMVDATYAALVDGCIVTGLEADDDAVHALKKRDVPFVMIDTDAPEDIAAVNVNDYEGARLGLKYLLEAGHRHVAIASFQSYTGKVDEYSGTLKHRFDGVRTALKAHKLSLRSEGVHTWECACSVAGGIEILTRILEQTPRPTAVFALADVIAYGVIEAAKTHGLRVPEDLAVVGFDDLESSSLISPALTTVRQPSVEKGRRAAEILMTMLDGIKRCDHVVLPVELMVRESA